MNKLEANLSLFLITFFAAIQYVFLKNIPDSVSHFAFLCITNLIGFIITFVVFFGELFRIDAKQIKQSMIMSAELMGFNIFLLLGSSGVDATVSACVLSAYFMFIPVISFLLFRKKTKWNIWLAAVIVLFGLFCFMKFDIRGLLNVHVLELMVCNIFFAFYIITTGYCTAKSNPAILSMGQLFFNFILSLFFWMGQSVMTHTSLELPADPQFWGSVIFISFFIRGMYGIVQIYAQRYVSAFNTSMIFSTEIIITMFMSPVLALVFQTEAEEITWYKIFGGIVIVLGILIADTAFIEKISGRRAVEK